MNIFDQVKLLYDSQLYGDLRILSSMVLTMSDHNPDLLTLPAKYQALVYQADALYHGGEYRKAETVYRKALQIKKMLNKTKGKSQVVDLPSDVEVRYRMYQCHCQLKQWKEAISVLEGINSKQRSSKINVALAKLYQKAGMDRSAITNYKEVLRECPLALEAALGLLALGVKGAEVASLMMNAIPNVTSMEWLSLWIKSHAFAASRDYANSVQTLKLLDSKGCLRDNLDLLCSVGETHFLNGDYSQAATILHRAHTMDPYLLHHMDVLSFLLAKEKKVKELENLATQLMSVTEQAPEPWIAMGYFCMATRKGTRAVYFAQKAYTLDNYNVEALLLKGSALLELKKTQEAIDHFREALRLAPHRYEAHKGLVDCYLSSHRTREATSYAGQAYKQLGQNARSLTLYASVLAKEPLSLEKAKTYLEKASKLDGTYLDAVYAMADILLQQQHYDRGIELLRKQLRQQNTGRLHQLLGNFLEHTNEHQEALDQYHIALSLDPSSVKAREGLERVEKHSSLSIESAYDVEVEDMDGSDNEADLEGSDIESAWSDIDLNDLS